MSSGATTVTDRSAEASRRRLLGAAWPLGWREVGVLVGWLALVVAVFTAIGELIVRSTIDDSDQSMSESIADRRTATGNDLAPFAAGLADTIVKVAVTTLIVGIMFAVWRRWRDPLIVALALIFEATAFITITFLVGRPRPDVERLQESPVNSSFPSGHVAAAAAYAAIALVLSRRFRSTAAKVAIWSLPVAVTAIVAAARLYQGMHFVSDVIAGIVLGVVSVAIVDHVVRRADSRP